MTDSYIQWHKLLDFFPLKHGYFENERERESEMNVAWVTVTGVCASLFTNNKAVSLTSKSAILKLVLSISVISGPIVHHFFYEFKRARTLLQWCAQMWHFEFTRPVNDIPSGAD